MSTSSKEDREEKEVTVLRKHPNRATESADSHHITFTKNVFDRNVGGR